MITKFEGEFRFLSNFFVEPDGTTVEHEFQAFKTVNIGQKAHVLGAPSPGLAKRRGRLVTIRSDWEDIKIDVMTLLVTKKFLEWPDLYDKLDDTGAQRLVEGNHWHDNFWGSCRCNDCRQVTHRNHLGKILMKVRSQY